MFLLLIFLDFSRVARSFIRDMNFATPTWEADSYQQERPRQGEALR